MKKLIWLLVVALLSTCFARECSSDYDCGVGYSCVKEMYKSHGECAKTIDGFGIQQFNPPRDNSIGIKTESQCSFNVDCPIGFTCHSGSCIKR
jgi:hypothetical protein